MHRRDFRLIAQVIAETALDVGELRRWTMAFSDALETSPDNFDRQKFWDGIDARVEVLRQPPASSTVGRADPEQTLDAPQHFADENTPADHYYRS